MKQTISGPSVPTAHICVNKSKLKIYNKDTDPTFYLEKGQEFSIELYNPTSDTILAKIKLNGKQISQGGLVLRPAERVFLERYIDVAKKFLFDTYEVKNTEQNKKAIEDNGDFTVEFYREQRPNLFLNGTCSTVHYPSTLTIPQYNPLQYYNSTPVCNPLQYTNTCGTGVSYSTYTSGQITTTSANAGGYTTLTSMNVNPSLRGSLTSISEKYSNSVTQDSLCDSNPQKTKSFGTLDSLMAKPKKSLSKTIETGIVEAGSQSEQKLETVSKSFESYAFHRIEYKLLPISQKVNTVADINIKRYCHNCGAKQKPEFKFCPSCGNKS